MVLNGKPQFILVIDYNDPYLFIPYVVNSIFICVLINCYLTGSMQGRVSQYVHGVTISDSTKHR